MIIEISVACVSFAFIVLVVFLIITLKKVNRVLDRANELTATINTQLDSFNPLLRSVSNLGSTVEHATESLHEKYLSEKPSRRDKVAEVCEMIAVSALLLQQFRKRR